MSDLETPQDDQLELGKHIQWLYPADLMVNDYLNLETESGSRHVFRVVSADEEGVFIEYVSGSKRLKGARGKLSDDIIELDGLLDFEGGNMSGLAGIVLTHGEPHQYITTILQYNEFLEELDVRQLKPGTYLYLIAEDGLTYIAEVLESDGKKPKIMFVGGENDNAGMEGKIKILDFRLGMRFRNTAKNTMAIKAMFVRPDLNTDMLDELDKEYSLPELEYDTELDKLLIAQLQHGDYVIITTANSSYVFKIEQVDGNRKIFEIVDGDNDFVQENGFFLYGKIRRKRKLRYANEKRPVTTSMIESIKVTKYYNPNVDAFREELDARQREVMNRPEHTNPGLWIAVTSGLHKQEIFDALDLNPHALTIGDLRAAWVKFEAENGPASRRDVVPYEYERQARWYLVIKEQYDALLKRLEDANK